MTLRTLCKATTAALLLSNSASPCRSQSSILTQPAAATFMTSPPVNGHVPAAKLPEKQAEERQHGAAVEAEQAGASSSKEPLLLPSPDEAAARTTDPHTLTVGGEGLKMDHLGPIVLNRDGTLSRIGNWDDMTEPERCATRRMVAKRNLQRKKMLEEQELSGT